MKMKFLLANTLAACVLFSSLYGNANAVPMAGAKKNPCRKALPAQPAPADIIKAVTAIANTDGYKGAQSLHDALKEELAQHPYPAPGSPYSDWNAYAKNLQTVLATDRTTSENASGTQITTDINNYITQNKLNPGDTWTTINQMKPSTSDINDGIFSAYATNIQNSLLNPIYSGKPGVLPDAPTPPPQPDIQPATETVLKINGVSYVLIPDPNAKDDPTKSMAFPVSHTSDAGGAAEADCTSTEAIWYTLQIAYNAKDQTLFQQTLNGYWYLTQQKLATIKIPGQDDSWAITAGETGWIIKLGIPPSSFDVSSSNFPYPQGDASNANISTATDADEHIIDYMIRGQKLFGDLVLHCFGNFPYGLGYQGDIHMSTITAEAVKTFLAFNISGTKTSSYDKAHAGFKYDGNTYNPVLSNDNWGGGQWSGSDPQNQGTFLNPSYFDPQTLANIGSPKHVMLADAGCSRTRNT